MIVNLKRPKIDDCSNLLQEIFDGVCASDSSMCHIDYDDWDEYYSSKYSKKNIQELQEEVSKYNLEDVLEIDNGKYQILGYGNLQFCFYDTRNLKKENNIEL